MIFLYKFLLISISYMVSLTLHYRTLPLVTRGETFARLTPRSLTLHLGFRLDVALPFAPLTPLAHSLCSYARPHALGGHAGYVVSLLLHYPHAPRGRTRDIPCLLPFAFLRPTYNLYRVAFTPKSHMD